MRLSQFIAGCFGIIGFVLAILAGLYAANDFSSILIRALLTSVACYVVGYVVGMMAQHVADEHAQRLAEQVMTLDHAKEAKRRELEAEAARQAAADAEAGESVAAAQAPIP